MTEAYADFHGERGPKREENACVLFVFFTEEGE